MKYLILILLIALHFTSHSQVRKMDLDSHKVDLHLPKITSHDPEIITLRPIDKIKITFRAGMNSSNNDFDLRQLVGYEYRVKYYVDKKFRVIFKDQVVTLGQNNYSLGFQIKF